VSSPGYRFELGEFECIAVADGFNTYGVRLLFPDPSEEELRPALERYGISGETMDVPYTCLVVRTGEGWLLVDTGLGAGVQPAAGKLVQNMAALGIEAREIDLVIISHGHGDHSGGLTDEEGRPTFPNARYVMGRAEWDFWTDAEALVEVGAVLPQRLLERSLAPGRAPCCHPHRG